MSETVPGAMPTETSGAVPDGESVPAAPATPADDGQLGEAGERTLRKLREEIKALKAELSAQRDAGDNSALPSDGASDSATDADAGQVATTGDDVKPTPPRFLGTVDGGPRAPASHARQLSRADLTGMSSRAIEAARRNGQLRNLLSGRDY